MGEKAIFDYSVFKYCLGWSIVIPSYENLGIFLEQDYHTKKQNTNMFQKEKISTSRYRLTQTEQKFYCYLCNQCQVPGCTNRL